MEKINKIDRLLPKLRKEKRLKLLKSEVKVGDITTNFTEVKIVITEYHEEMWANKLYNLDEMDKSLERYKIPNPKSKFPGGLLVSYLPVLQIL